MGFTKINNVSLTDLFIQQIENMILSGELAIGEQLPPARELAVKMGVSRPVISAGLIELEKLGFVEIQARKGAFVSDYRRKGTVETLVAIMRYNGGAMRKNEVESLLEVRHALESLTLKLVVEKATDQELVTLKELLDSYKAITTPEAMAEAVFNFHHELAVISGNMLLPLLYHSFKPESTYLWTMSCRKFGCEQLLETKFELYEAIMERDFEKAISLTDHSIQVVFDHISSFIS